MRTFPCGLGTIRQKIENTDELITQIIPVRSVDAVKLKTDIQPLVDTNADLTANAASNSLMITDTSANIRRVVEIVSSLDKARSDGQRHPGQAAEVRRCDGGGDADHEYLQPAETREYGRAAVPFGNPTHFSDSGGGHGGGGGLRRREGRRRPVRRFGGGGRAPGWWKRGAATARKPKAETPGMFRRRPTSGPILSWSPDLPIPWPSSTAFSPNSIPIQSPIRTFSSIA